MALQRFVVQLVVMFLMLQLPYTSTYSTTTTESSGSGDIASYSWLRIGVIGVLPLAAVSMTHLVVPMKVHLPLGILSLWIMGIYAVMLVNQGRSFASALSIADARRVGGGGGTAGTAGTAGAGAADEGRGDKSQVVLMVLMMIQLLGGFLLPMVAINVIERRYRMKFLRLQEHLE